MKFRRASRAPREFDPDYLEYLEDLDEIAMMEAQFRAAAIAAAQEQGDSFVEIPVIPVASVSAIIAIVLLGIGAWRWNLRGQPESVRAYSQFIRVASILGYRRPSHESAREFTGQIGGMTGRYADARRIITAFEKSIYGSPASEKPETLIMDETPDTNEGETETEITNVAEPTNLQPDLGTCMAKPCKGDVQTPNNVAGRHDSAVCSR